MLNVKATFSCIIAQQIADFGMSRDLEENYYVSHGGKIPVKWTAPEVRMCCLLSTAMVSADLMHRHYTTRSILLLATCGAMESSCTKSGVWDSNHIRILLTLR
jgi:hypothetical protein